MLPNGSTHSVIGLNDHELVHEVEETVDKLAAENCEAVEWADWAAGFFQDVAGFFLEAALSLAL